MKFPEITDPLFRQAMELPPDNQVEDKVAATLAKLQSALGDHHGVTLQAPEIVYDLKGHTAGEAWYSASKGINKIRVNLALLYSDNPATKESMINQTVPHEVAHIVCSQLYPRAKSHGGEWQYIMLVLGLSPERCHNYETTPARNKGRLPRPYIYACGSCGREYRLTQILHRRIKNEGQTRICRDCKVRIHYVKTVIEV